MHSCIVHHVFFFYYLLFIFTLSASICHDWIIEHLWARTGFQLSHHRHSPSTSSYQEAQPESDQWNFRCEEKERQHQSQKWIFWLPEFWKVSIYCSQVTSGCSTHNRHQSNFWEQPHQAWQWLLRGQCWSNGEQFFCQPKLLIRSLWSSGATLLTSWTITTLVFFLEKFDYRPQSTLLFRHRLYMDQLWIHWNQPFAICIWACWLTL